MPTFEISSFDSCALLGRAVLPSFALRCFVVFGTRLINDTSLWCQTLHTTRVPSAPSNDQAESRSRQVDKEAAEAELKKKEEAVQVAYFSGVDYCRGLND